MNDKMGVVKWFHEGKGYGFITSGDKEYFVHFKEIKKVGFKTLNENQKVRFVPVKGDRGDYASEVYPADDVAI